MEKQRAATVSSELWERAGASEQDVALCLGPHHTWPLIVSLNVREHSQGVTPKGHSSEACSVKVVLKQRS